MDLGTLVGGVLPRMAAGAGDFWMPFQGSTTAPAVDRLFYFIFWVSVVFFVLIVGLSLLFVIRYRARRGHTAEPSAHHNTALELTWTVIPLILVVVIFAWGFMVFMDMTTAPANAQEVQVTGQKWKWLFTYPNGHVDENLHVPVDAPVNLVMTSEDVIHSFFVPAFRLKRDVVPGRYTTTWFRATAPGEYQIYCAEYCGTAHADMLAKVVVHPPGGYERWLADAGNLLDRMSPAEAGQLLATTRGCFQCHSVDGRSGIGPTFQGTFGSRRPLGDGGLVLMDENYIRESILDPNSRVVAGYEPVMPTYRGRLTDQEITAIIEYLKTLQ